MLSNKHEQQLVEFLEFGKLGCFDLTTSEDELIGCLGEPAEVIKTGIGIVHGEDDIGKERFESVELIDMDGNIEMVTVPVSNTSPKHSLVSYQYDNLSITYIDKLLASVEVKFHGFEEPMHQNLMPWYRHVKKWGRQDFKRLLDGHKITYDVGVMNTHTDVYAILLRDGYSEIVFDESESPTLFRITHSMGGPRNYSLVK